MSKISELSDGGVIQGGDTLIAVRSGGNVKVTYGGSTTANIDGGTIDGTVIGGSTAAAGTFTSFTSTGIDDNATSTAITIDASENVGIGTSSPSQMLELSADNGSGVANVLRFNDAATGVSSGQTTGRIEFAENDGGNTTVSAFLEVDTVGTSGGGVMTFGTGSAGVTATERMRIDGSGNLGLGVAPTANGNYAVFDIKGRATAAAGIIKFFDGDGTNTGTIQSDINYGMLLGAAGARPIALFTNGTERMRIDSSGNVGIGTSSPTSPIHVQKSTGSGGVAIAQFRDESPTSGGNGLLVDVTNTPNTYVADFRIGNSSNVRIDSSGNLLVGTSTSQGRITANAADGVAAIGTIVASAINYNAISFHNNAGTQVGRILANNAGTTQYITSSDQRLKENIADANDAGDKIDAIQVRQYDWKADGSHQDYGMIAQELQAVAPEAVAGDADSEEIMGVDYSKLVPMLVKEIQSLRARVAQLEN